MIDFKEIEDRILNFWEKEKIYERVKEKNKNGKKFYFLQGPPYTSERIHIGHAWNNTLKDMILRYKRLNGFDVWDRGGYDMHGLPTENAVQKKLGLKNKNDITKYGIKNFIKKCMDFSQEMAAYACEDLWKFGVWMDHKNSYMPIKKEFISGQWAFFKKAHEQKRLYKGTKVMHWDAENETVLAKHELEYKTIKEKSIFLKFKRKDKENEYFLIWTTTPWTIPFNLGIMVNPQIDYVKIRVEMEKGKEEYWIIAKALAGIFMSSVVGKKYKVVEEFKGKELEGIEYEHFLEEEVPSFKELKKKWPKIHTIFLSEKYVNTNAGTGLVHCAPGCGPEDEEVGREYGVGSYNTLDERGRFTEGEFKGWVAKKDDKKFIEYFKKKGNLIAITEVEHEYPHSWRSHKPVIFRTTEQWFLKTTDLIPTLLKFNEKVHWVPKKAKESYERWISNLKDNSVTRQRFWGCPIPIWVNVKDKNDYLVIGSVEELEKLTGKKFDDLNLHRPWIDEIIIKKNGKEYKRIEDVCDVWIDSGTTSWNCLYNDPELIKRYFPADLVLEGIEQTRLWFSLLQICSAIMFNRSAYKNVYAHGMILDFEGVKMSKSLGNVISPYEVIDKFSVDIFRYYICETNAGENINFNWEDVKQKQRNLLVLKNISKYILDLKNQLQEKKSTKKKNLGLEEKYIISRLNSTIKRVTELFEKYNLDKTITEMEKFFLDLSRGYIQLIREKVLEEEGREVVFEVLVDCYVKLLKMFSTVCPFITEEIWQDFKKNGLVEEDSVHLTEWPKYNENYIDPLVEKRFEIVFKIIEKGLAERDKAKIGSRWPLAKAWVKLSEKLPEEYIEIIKRRLNVKEIEEEIIGGKEIKVELDTTLTPELEAEGYAREISRKVQAARKKAGFVKTDFINLALVIDDKLKNLIKNHLEFIKKKTNSKEILIEDIEENNYKNRFEEKIKDKKLIILFNKT